MNHESGDQPKPPGSSAIWLTALAGALLFYVISPPIVSTLFSRTLGPGALCSSSTFRVYLTFHWPLIKLEEAGLRHPMERFYRRESRMTGGK